MSNAILFERASQELQQLANRALNPTQRLTTNDGIKAQVLSSYLQANYQDAFFHRQTELVESQKESLKTQMDAVKESKKQYKWVMSLAVATMLLAVATIGLALVEYYK